MSNLVEASGLVKHYGSFTAVNGVDFSISPGEFYGFLGPNGAGKTTIMRMISCYLPPSAGVLNVFGMPVQEKDSVIKARLGIMPQDDNLDPELTVLENLIVYANYFDIPKKEAKSRALELLAMVELEDRKDRRIMTLSGGMKRRLLLARSVVNRPELLILDEPTTGLDPHSRHLVWEKLDMLKAQGTTIIMTTHYMEEAENLCDRVAIIDRGKVVTVDTPHYLMDKHGGNMEHVYLTLTGRSLDG